MREILIEYQGHKKGLAWLVVVRLTEETDLTEPCNVLLELPSFRLCIHVPHWTLLPIRCPGLGC